MTKQFLATILIFIVFQFIKLFQKILNFIFKLFINNNYPNLKKIKNDKKNQSQIIYESNSLIDTKLAHYVTLRSFNSMGFDNILFYNMSINSLYNPRTFFFYRKLNLDNINYILSFNQIVKTVRLFFEIKKKNRFKRKTN